MAALICSHHQGDTNFFRAHFAQLVNQPRLGDIAPYLYWFCCSVVLYLLLPLGAAALTPGIRARDTGLGPGDWRVGVAATAALLGAFLPVVYLASLTPEFAGHYPLCSGARLSWGVFLLYELAYAAYFVAWEYLFRGYLLFSLEPAMGRLAAFVQMMPFAVVHFGKPEAETFGAIIAGVVLGLLALRTRSFWYGAAVHITVAVFMDTLTTFRALVH